MNSMLTTIADHKRKEIEIAKSTLPIRRMNLENCSPTRDFCAALQDTRPAVIAEIKKGSPSKGIIRQNFNVAEIASDYAEHGAQCLSVLTDEMFFYGHRKNIEIARQHCQLPILRKDFILDNYQIYESRFLGADCILLIVAMLSDSELSDFCALAHSLSMAVLVESHNESELERALSLPTPLIGINNRDLDTFKTDLNTSIRLKGNIPADRVIISESGIHTKEDISQLRQADIHCFLIGESLMREEQPGIQLQQLLSI